MAWYTILFITVFSFFFIKLIISLFAGDIDLDVDMDGDSDVDSSSVFSFKGILHFLMGFSAFLFGKAHMSNVTIENGYVQFTLFDYVFAILSGIVLVVILYFAYKIALKANCEPKQPKDLIDNSKGKIYLNMGDGKYSVEASTQAGTINVEASSNNKDLKPGDEVTLKKDNDKIIIDYDTEGSIME